ncbi:MAG: cyclase family protein [Armatimonadota bacterium]|nr:cyclase family protein [Armatimonadota bacterium]
MRLIDLSQPLYDDCPNCPVHPPVRSEIIANHPEDGWLVEKLTLVNHSGSHVDAPLHKIAGGASLDEIPLEKWVGPAFIADLRDSSPDLEIGPELLSNRLPAVLEDHIVLLATGWGDRRAKTDEWHYHSPRLSAEGARWLVNQRVRGVGIDHYSIGGSAEPQNSETHAVLLGNGVWIVEELRFPPEVWALPQPVSFWSLPINLKGHSGAFCRPVIVVE